MKKYINFFHVFKELRALYQKHQWGDSPNLPGPFTEDLIAHLYNLNKSKDTSKLEAKAKGNDLSDSNGNEYEVKATTSASGTTTVKNSSIKFHKLYWLYCDFDTETFSVKTISFQEYKKVFDKHRRDKTNYKRIGMNLSILPFEKNQVFCMNTLEEIDTKKLDKLKVLDS